MKPTCLAGKLSFIGLMASTDNFAISRGFFVDLVKDKHGQNESTQPCKVFTDLVSITTNLTKCYSRL
jgi:hypothetical protein